MKNLEWVDVREEKPEERVLCIVADETGAPCTTEMLTYNKEKDYWTNDEGYIPDGEVLAWLNNVPKYHHQLNRNNKGEWVLSWDSPCYPICSLCKREPDYSGDVMPHYCPNCGAQMINYNTFLKNGK